MKRLFIVILLLMSMPLYAQNEPFIEQYEIEGSEAVLGADTSQIDSLIFKNRIVSPNTNFTRIDTPGVSTKYIFLAKDGILVGGKDKWGLEDYYSIIEFFVSRRDGTEPDPNFLGRSNITHDFGHLVVSNNLYQSPIGTAAQRADSTLLPHPNWINQWNYYDETDNWTGVLLQMTGGTDGAGAPNKEKPGFAFYGGLNAPGEYVHIRSMVNINFDPDNRGMVVTGDRGGSSGRKANRDLTVIGSLWADDSVFALQGLVLAYSTIGETDTTQAHGADTVVIGSDTFRVGADAFIVGGEPWRAFDGSASTVWQSDGTTTSLDSLPRQIVYSFPSAVEVKRISLAANAGFINSFRVIGTDSVTSDTLLTVLHPFGHPAINDAIVYDLDTTAAYQHYIVQVINIWGTTGGGSIRELEFYTDFPQDTAVMKYDPNNKNILLIVNGDTIVLADTIIQNMKINNLATDTIRADQNNSIRIISPVEIDSIGALGDTVYYSSPIKGTSFTGDSVNVPVVLTNSILSANATDINLQLFPLWSAGKVQLFKGTQTDTIGSLDKDTVIFISPARIESLFANLAWMDDITVNDTIRTPIIRGTRTIGGDFGNIENGLTVIVDALDILAKDSAHVRVSIGEQYDSERTYDYILRIQDKQIISGYAEGALPFYGIYNNPQFASGTTRGNIAASFNTITILGVTAPIGYGSYNYFSRLTGTIPKIYGSYGYAAGGDTNLSVYADGNLGFKDSLKYGTDGTVGYITVGPDSGLVVNTRIGDRSVNITGGTRDIWINPYNQGIPDSIQIPDSDSHKVTFAPMADFTDGYDDARFGLQHFGVSGETTQECFANFIVLNLGKDFRSFDKDSGMVLLTDANAETGDSITFKIFDAAGDSTAEEKGGMPDATNTWTRKVYVMPSSVTFTAGDRMIIRFYHFIKGGDRVRIDRFRIRINLK